MLEILTTALRYSSLIAQCTYYNN